MEVAEHTKCGRTGNQSISSFLTGNFRPEVLPYMNIYMDEPTTGETVLWEGFYGVPKLTDIEKDGVSTLWNNFGSGIWRRRSSGCRKK